jgi:hypothetical protein
MRLGLSQLLYRFRIPLAKGDKVTEQPGIVIVAL